MIPFDPMPAKLNIEKLADVIYETAMGRCTTYMLTRTCIDEQIDPLEVTVDMLVALAMSIPADRRMDWGSVTAIPDEPWCSAMKLIAVRASRLSDSDTEVRKLIDVKASRLSDAEVLVEEE